MLCHVITFLLLGLAVQINTKESVKFLLFATSEGKRLASNVDETVPSVRAISGSSLTFHCTLEVPSKDEETSEPVFKWFHDGERIGNSSRFTESMQETGSRQKFHSKIRVTHLQQSDSGIFGCVISTREMPDMAVTSKINLIVFSNPILRPLNVTIIYGMYANLTCLLQTEDSSVLDVTFIDGIKEIRSSKLNIINSTAVYTMVHPEITSVYYCSIGELFSNPAYVYVINITTERATSQLTSAALHDVTTSRSNASDSTRNASNEHTTIKPITTKSTNLTPETKNTATTSITSETAAITTNTPASITTPVTTQDKTTPVTTQDKTTPVTTQDKTTPVTTQDKTTLVTTHDKTTPVTTQDKTTLVTTQDKTTPVTTHDKTTPVTTQDKTTPATTQDKTTLVTTQDKTTPVTTQNKTTPVTTQDKTTPATTQDKTTLVTTQDKTDPVTTQDKTTPVTTQDKTTLVTTPVTSNSTINNTPVISQDTTTPAVTSRSATTPVTSQDRTTLVTIKSTQITTLTTTKTNEITKNTSISSETIPVTSEVTKTTSVTDDVTKTTSVTGEVTKTTSVTDDVMKNTSVAGDVIIKTTSVTSEVKTTTPVTDDVLKTTNVTDVVSKTTSVTGDVTKTTSVTGDVTKTTSVTGDVTKTTPVTAKDTKTTSVTSEATKPTPVTHNVGHTTTRSIPSKDTIYFTLTSRSTTASMTLDTTLPASHRKTTAASTTSSVKPSKTTRIKVAPSSSSVADKDTTTIKSSTTNNDKTRNTIPDTTSTTKSKNTRSTTTRSTAAKTTTQERASTTTQTTTVDVKTNSITQSTVMCEAVNGRNGIMWEKTVAGNTRRIPCPSQYEGEASRYCSEEGTWHRPDMTECKNKLLLSMTKQVATMKEDPDEVFKNVSQFVKNRKQTMMSGDIQLTMTILQDAVESIKLSNTSQLFNTTDMFGSIDGMLDVDWDQWMDLSRLNKTGAARLMVLSENMVMLTSERLKHGMTIDSRGKPGNTVKSFRGKNLYLEYGRMKPGAIQFPNTSTADLSTSLWVDDMETKSVLPLISVNTPSTDTDFIGYGGIIYRNISSLLTQKRHGWKPGDSTSWIVNSPVLSLSLETKPTGELSQPLFISFKHTITNLSSPVCSYLSFDPPFQMNGRWSSAGCSVVKSSTSVTLCKCNHLTNFAILMSPSRTVEGDHGYVLSVISLVGCAISVLCLCLTIISYACLWRYVKSDPAVILLNLCVALIISYGLFVFGVSLTDNQIVCTVVAALLHYFYLAVFAFMLAEGIDVFLSVTTVFKVTSRLPRLLSLGWGGPLLIVGFSMGFTQMNGYGNSKFCWLSLDSGLLWAFVGPALGVIVINAVIVIVVLKAMFRESTTEKKSSFDKARTGLRAICVLMPVMGLTWVFGVFSVNQDLMVFQYLFAVFNSLQGLFIFIFHCFTSKQIRTGMNSKIRRYQAHRLNSSASKYFSQTASQRYPNKLTSKKSNASQKIKLSNQSSDAAGGDVATINVNTREQDYSKHCYENAGQSAMMTNSFHQITYPGGVVNQAFIYSCEDDVFYAGHNEAPLSDLTMLKTASLETSPCANYSSMELGGHNAYHIQVLHPVSNMVVLDKPNCNTQVEECHMACTPVNMSRDLTNPMICHYDPNQERQSTNSLTQRRDVSDLPKLVLPCPIRQHSCQSISSSTPPSAQSGKVRRRLPSVRFNEEEKMSADLEQKLKERRKRLDQIYGVVEAIWPYPRQQDGASSYGDTSNDENKNHHRHLSTLQHIKAKANWTKLKCLFLGRRGSGCYILDHEWFSTPTPSDLCMHGSFHPFGGITLPSPQFHSLSWEENAPEWSSVQFDVFPSVKHT